MYVFKSMIDHLQQKPVIGVIGAFSSTMFFGIKTFLTDQAVLSGISIAGIYIGFFIALLTGMIKMIELFRLVRKKK